VAKKDKEHKKKKDKSKKDKGKKGKDKSKALKVQPAEAKTFTPGQTYEDGTPLDQVTYLEAKLILKPDRFTSVQSFRDFGKIVQKTAKKVGVGFIADPEAGLRPQIREITFGDTSRTKNRRLRWTSGRRLRVSTASSSRPRPCR